MFHSFQKIAQLFVQKKPNLATFGISLSETGPDICVYITFNDALKWDKLAINNFSVCKKQLRMFRE